MTARGESSSARGRFALDPLCSDAATACCPTERRCALASNRQEAGGVTGNCPTDTDTQLDSARGVPGGVCPTQCLCELDSRRHITFPESGPGGSPAALGQTVWTRPSLETRTNDTPSLRRMECRHRRLATTYKAQESPLRLRLQNVQPHRVTASDVKFRFCPDDSSGACVC